MNGFLLVRHPSRACQMSKQYERTAMHISVFKQLWANFVLSSVQMRTVCPTFSSESHNLATKAMFVLEHIVVITFPPSWKEPKCKTWLRVMNCQNHFGVNFHTWCSWVTEEWHNVLRQYAAWSSLSVRPLTALFFMHFMEILTHVSPSFFEFVNSLFVSTAFHCYLNDKLSSKCTFFPAVRGHHS